MNRHAIRRGLVTLGCVLFVSLAMNTHAGGYAYRSPLALEADATGHALYVAERGASDLAFLDLATTQVVKHIRLPGEPSGLAWSKDRTRLYVTCSASRSTIAVVNVAKGRVFDEIRAGHTAIGPAVSPDGTKLYVCYRFDSCVGVIDLERGREIARIPVPREPISAVCTPSGQVLVAHHLHEGPADADVVAANLTVIDAASGKVSGSLKLPNGSTLLREIRVSPDGKYAVVTHNLARFQLPTTQLDRGWMNTSAFTIVDLAKMQVVNTVLLDGVDSGAANPWGLGWTADGAKLCVAHAGTHEISVIDFPGVLAKLAKAKAEDVPNDLAFLVDLRQRIPAEGIGPRGLVVAGSTAYTANYFSGDVSALDLRATPLRAAHVSLGPKENLAKERQGERWFNDATICFQGWQSCASCHSDDARVDGLNWDLLNDGIGNPKNNKSMLFVHRTPPAMSLGIRDSGEAAVRAGIRFIEFSVQPPEVPEAIDAYLKLLRPVPSPHLVDGELSKAARRGRDVFKKVGCATCHPSPLFTDLNQYEQGDGKGLDKGKAFDTPTLVEVWRTAPYFHDGRFATVKDVVEVRRHGISEDAKPTKQELDDLVEYVLSL